MITLLTLVLMWIPDSNGSTFENRGPFPMNSLQRIKGVMTLIPTVGNVGGCFLQKFVCEIGPPSH